MEKSTLNQLVRSFTSVEIRDLRKFLGSSFFNQRADLTALFDLLSQEKGDPDKQEIWRRMMGGAPFDDQKLRLLMSYLHRLLEEYLSLTEQRSDALERQLSLAVAYRKRGMQDAFERVRRQAVKMMQDQPLRDMQFYQRQFRLDWEYFQVAGAKDPTEVSFLLELSETADVAYLAQKLRIVCLLEAQRNVYQLEKPADWAESVIEMAESSGRHNLPAIRVYLHCYRMLRFPEEEAHFYAFKQALLEEALHFPEEEMHGLYIWAVNYCVRRLNAGDVTYYGEVLQLYKASLDKGVIFENGTLSRFTYHNVVAAGLHMGELEWVRFFINEYKNRLEKKYRESSFSYSLARLEFASQNYQFVLELLQKANYRDPLLNLGAKMLLVKTFFEMGEYDVLPSCLDAMRNYIHRKRVIGYHRSNYLNIIRFTERILRLNLLDKNAAAQLSAAIEKEPVLTEKSFLQKMLLVMQ